MAQGPLDRARDRAPQAGLFDEPAAADPRPPAAPPAASPERAAPAPAPRAVEREAPPEPPLYSVGQLTGAINGKLQELGRVRVEGEIGELKRHASGHVYFCLKDEGAKLACKIWQSKVRPALRGLQPKDGMKVIAHGRLDVYPPRGEYSLIVERVEPLGIGALLAELERLKAELKARGWFDRSRALPAWPDPIGVVTSRDGAALADFLRTRSLRWPGYPLRLAHSAVQGPGAAEEIARAIERVDSTGVALIVVCRGGGALEDLWAFNELAVASAIWHARVPVVTGIGHESDTTLADLVADHRAHTPTDAAQTVIPDREALCGELARWGNFLIEAGESLVRARSDRLAELSSRPVLCGAEWILGERRRALRSQGARLAAAVAAAREQRLRALHGAEARLERRSPREALGRLERRVAGAGLRLRALGALALERAGSSLAAKTRALEATSPLAVLGRGYSVTRKQGAAQALTDAATLALGEQVETRLSRGSFIARVESVEPGEAAP